MLAPIYVISSVVSNNSPSASALSISSVYVDRGPTSGGTNVTITGDFTTPGVRVTQISTGQNHACAIDSDGKAYCWGANSGGQLGNNSYSASLVPVAVDTSGVLNGKTLVQISAATNSNFSNSGLTCAIDSDGKAYCWGEIATEGRLLGDGITDSSPVPIAVDTSGVLNGKTLVQISANFWHICAIDSDGKAYCWGINTGGRLGDGSTTNASVPVAVDTSGVLDGKVLVQISAGQDNTCAVNSDGKAYCWGGNSSGQLGNNSTTGSLVPVAVDTSGVLSGETLVQISAGRGTACAIDVNGRAYCWGRNSVGQLGNNSTISSLAPVVVDTSGVSRSKTLTQVSVGGGFGSDISACAINSSGKAYCWGQNSFYGRLGNNSTINSLVPTRVHTNADINDLPTVSQLPEGYDVSIVVIFDAGGIQAECINVVVAPDERSLTCTTTAHPAGWVNVTVDNGISSFTLIDAFEYYEIGVPDTGSVR